ncbi:MAG: LysR family transcriptional regulator [Bacteroidetes bacterium]|nr:LysR family transcriptional regulator [Bacteroidota bacterium]
MPSSIKNIFKKGLNISISGSLWIESGTERFLGPGPVELLERISKTGSINQAAKQMGMSYQKAWRIVNTLNTQTAKPVVIVQTGGEKGGGSTISDEAKQLIKYHGQLRERFTAFLKKETIKLKK